MAHTTFQGFGTGARQFFAELQENNNREWFERNRERYERHVLKPAEVFVRDLGSRLADGYPGINYGTKRNGTESLMRIYRDVRFSRDKRPYKENLGIVFWMGPGKKVEEPGFYFHLDATGAFFYGGRHMFPKAALERYRRAVDQPQAGSELSAILQELKEDGLALMEEPAYKRVPQGYAKDHPREGLLRLGGVGVSSEVTDAELSGPHLVGLCLDYANRVRPLIRWLLQIDGREIA